MYHLKLVLIMEPIGMKQNRGENMKEVKKFLIANFIILLVKILGSYLCKSYTLLASCIYELLIMVESILVYKNKDNKKYKAIFASLLAFLFILSSIGTFFICVISGVKRTSLLVILFVVICLICRYVVSCFNSNIGYSKKLGLIAYSNLSSNLEFLQYGIIVGSAILCFIGKWVKILKYGDMIGCALVVIMIIIKGIKIVVNSFKYLEEKEDVVKNEFKEEVSKRNEVKRVENIEYVNYGGIRKLNLFLEFNDNISLIDLNTFIVTLTDYCLKVCDVVNVVLVKKKENIYKKVINNARNSRSGNSKANTKKTNSRKKNKKR